MPAIQLMTASATETTPAAAVPGTKPQKAQSLQSTFSNYMNQNSSNAAQTARQQTAVVPQAKTADSDSSVRQQYEQYQSQSAAQSDKIANAADGTGADTDAVTEAVEEAVETIKESIRENLGVDDEQIEAAMEVLGLTQVDLLDPQQLVALAMELTGSEDAGMMLFQENFQIVMQETSAVTTDLLQELGMSMDELMTQIHTALENTEQPLETMLPQQEAAADVPVQEEVQQTVTLNTQEEVQQVPQEAAVPVQTAETEETPQREAVQVQQVQETQKTSEAQPQTDVEQEAQPQETRQVQQTAQTEQTKQENPQTGEKETATQQNPADALLKNQDTVQENPRFDFHAAAHQQEPAVNVQTPQNLTSQAPLPQVNLQDVIDQIVQYTRINISEDVKSIEMQLNPENLGKVYLHVSEKEGAVTAQLTAQNENLKDALVQQAAILKENLNQQGIKVDAVEVSAGAHEFESNLERDAHSQEEQARQQEEQHNRRSRRSINLGEINDLDGISGLMSEEETLVAQMMRDNGNNVDYKA